jgi:peptidoglycan-associated lipoprotein
MPRFAKNLAKLAFFALLGVVLAVGCGGPKYPSCDSDEHCNADGHHGVCVNHTCVECRSDDACPKGKSCSKDGVCTDIPGYCDDSHACSGGGTCGKDHRCQPPKTSSAPPVECDDDHPCKGPGEKCQNGHCVAPVAGGPGCTDFPAPKFDFESPTLRTEGKDVLQRLAKCLLTGTLKGRRVLLTGHCDARGEYEFNMGLGAERAEGVKTFLVGLGVPTESISTSSRGKLDANGTDEIGWANDRRVDVEVR